MQCNECGKWRLLHCKNKLKRANLHALDHLLEDVIYTCGANIADIEEDGTDQPLIQSVYSMVYSRLDLTCMTKIEVPYYSAGFEDICIHCGTTDDLKEVGKEFYPICCTCLSDRKVKEKRRTRVFKPKD